MKSATIIRKPLGVRVTLEQHRILTEAAERSHRSVSSFVLNAALEAARGEQTAPRKSREEIQAIFQAAREAVKEANPTNRDLLEELLAERRAEAARE